MQSFFNFIEKWNFVLEILKCFKPFHELRKFFNRKSSGQKIRPTNRYSHVPTFVAKAFFENWILNPGPFYLTNLTQLIKNQSWGIFVSLLLWRSTNIWHYITILSKWWKGLELVSCRHSGAKNKLEMLP